MMILYNDFGTANPLENKVSTPKISAFYFAFVNIPDKYRSCLYDTGLGLLSSSALAEKLCTSRSFTTLTE